MMKSLRRILASIDLLLVFLLLLLLTGSLIILSTASYNIISGDPYHYVKSQAIWILTGLCLLLAVSFIDYKHYQFFMWWIYGLCIALLLFVEIFGQSVRGSQRWLYFFSGVGIQPSEFAKIMVIMTFANFLARRKDHLNRVRDFLLPFLFVAAPMVLVFLQPDLGTALVFAAIFTGMMFIAGANPVKFGALIGGTITVGIAAIYLNQASPEALPGPLKFLAGLPLPLKPYQLQRILGFLNPEHATSDLYQVEQSIWAIGSGGLWGKGYRMGTQGQLNFLPDHHTDFIFSVVGEEFGFIGTSILLFIFCIFLLRCISVAMRSRDLYGMLLVAGVVSMWTFQIFVNIGMASGIMPVTGLPLPFITSGGSSMWSNLIGVGLVFSVYARRERAMF